MAQGREEPEDQEVCCKIVSESTPMKPHLLDCLSLRKLPSSDWMNLRRDLNFGLLALLRLLWTMGSFEIELNVFLIMLWLGMAPTDSCV